MVGGKIQVKRLFLALKCLYMAFFHAKPIDYPDKRPDWKQGFLDLVTDLIDLEVRISEGRGSGGWAWTTIPSVVD
jgi:hypothetical protein